MPETWPERPFQELYAAPSRNGLMAPSRTRGAGLPLVNMREMFAYDRVADQDMELAPPPKELSNWLLAAGDLLFARQSLTLAGAGKCVLVLPSEQQRLFESHIIRVRLDQGLCDPRFYFYYFRSYIGRSRIKSIVEQVAAAGIRATDLARLQVPVPPLPVQQRIADALEALDDLIDTELALVTSCRQLASAQLSQAATGRPRVRVRDCAEVRRGLSYKGSGLSTSGLPMVNMGSAENFGWLKRSGWKYYTGEHKERHLARGGDLLVTNTEQTWRNDIIGWPMLLPADVPAAIFTHHTYLVAFKPENAWMRLPLWAFLYSDEARSVLTGAVRGTTVANLPADAVEALSFPLPDSDDPALPAAQALLDCAWDAELAADSYRTVRGDLLSSMMTGRISCADPVLLAS